VSRTQEISRAWSDLYPGLWVRLVTPSVVRSGRIVRIQKRSMMVDWLDIGERALPDAKHYFAAWKMRLWGEGHKPEYYLELIPTPGTVHDKTGYLVETALSRGVADSELLDVHDVCAIVNLDAKSVRRRLRSGSLEGFREGGTRWRVTRRAALDLARKLGR